MHSALLRCDILRVDLLRRALLVVLLLTSFLGAAVLPASAADLDAPTGSWSAETPATIDQGEFESLEVREPGASEEYDRDEFGPAWEDVDGNDCDTRIISSSPVP